MFFLEQNCHLRIDESFNLRQNSEHYTGSIFESIQLPMVTTFPLDWTCIWYVSNEKKWNLWLRELIRFNVDYSANK